jgi:uncharacterized cupin superfamily protein
VPKIDVEAVPERSSTSYPEAFREPVAGRFSRALGKAAGMTQFGVNLVRLAPGAWSSQRHWHEQEDEFLLMLDGELVLVEDEGETVMRPGDAAGFKAGVPNGHHLINRTGRDAVFLVVGTRAPSERAHYPDIDLFLDASDGQSRFMNKKGEPYA